MQGILSLSENKSFDSLINNRSVKYCLLVMCKYGVVGFGWHWGTF